MPKLRRILRHLGDHIREPRVGADTKSLDYGCGSSAELTIIHPPRLPTAPATAIVSAVPVRTICAVHFEYELCLGLERFIPFAGTHKV